MRSEYPGSRGAAARARTLVVSVCIATSAVSVQTVQAQPALTRPLPTYIAEIREAQSRLAGEAGVTVRFMDSDERSVSSLDGVPAEFREVLVASEYDLESILDRLYEYYGFTGTESLEFEFVGPGFDEEVYYFRQYIAGISTDNTVGIRVSLETHRINEIRGGVYLDRDLLRIPEMSEQHAIDVARCFAGRSDMRLDGYEPGGKHEVGVVYKIRDRNLGLIPVWSVALESSRGDRSEALAILPGDLVSRSSVSSHRDINETYLCAQVAPPAE